MNRVGRWGSTLLFAATVGAVFALLLVWSSPPAPEEGLVGYAVDMAMAAVPWALAGGILWRAWWVRSGVRLSNMDAPERLLATAVATLPAERRDWGVAMIAELAQVPDRRARWRFAGGCARTAVFPPRGHRISVAAVAALATATVVVTGLAVGHALPTMRGFAITFAALVGAMATIAVAWSRRLHRPAHGPLITVTGLAGVTLALPSPPTAWEPTPPPPWALRPPARWPSCWPAACGSRWPRHGR